MKIKDLPPFIQAIALKRQREQGNNPNLEVDLIDLDHSGNFDWSTTPEMHSIWFNVYKGNFTPFYEFHHKYAKELEREYLWKHSPFGIKVYQSLDNILVACGIDFLNKQEPKPYYLTKTIKIKESERTITLCAAVSGKELNVGYAVMNPKDKKIDKKLAKEIALGRTKKGSLVSLDITDDLKQNYIFKSILENVFHELERGILVIKGIR